MRRAVGEIPWETRVAAVAVEELQVRIELYSDGWNLETKTSFESFVVDAMRQRYPGVARWVVYMRRKEAAPSSGDGRSAQQPQRSQPSPQSAAQASGPKPGNGASSGVAPGSGPSKLAGSRRAIEGVRSIIAVASGKGGVGKSTVSVNLAVALSNQGYRVGILDADIYGPSVPMMLGVEVEPTVNERNKIVPPEARGIKVMSFGFFAGEDSAVIWRGPMIMKALQQFFYDVEWGELDYLVIDLPPGTGDAQLTLVQSLPVDGAVIVTTPQNVALADAVKGIVMFRKTEVPVLGVIENMATYHCPSCGHESHVFGQGGAEKVSQKFEVPVLGQIPLNGDIRAAGDDGHPLTAVSGHPIRVRFAEIASRVVALLAEPKKSLAPKISPFVQNQAAPGPS
jgi:ATP-binding protein involved in chromosome partitioning